MFAVSDVGPARWRAARRWRGADDSGAGPDARLWRLYQGFLPDESAATIEGDGLVPVRSALLPGARHLVLDSAVHPEWIWHEQFRQQAVAYRHDVEMWAAWVGERNEKFGLGKSRDEVIAEVEKVAAKLHTAPVGAHDRSAFDGGNIGPDLSFERHRGLPLRAHMR